ncbi:hypothetical protein NA2_18861 [Nitratireductor pacificus pht-3B]|uniref:Uncharacterized protein n=1 Tax=Nitratireductor pacificus pht-3B TaxID=391937 RepID=K2MZ12_9HYPH|nr:hypothetical protein NA2_18861 [Nitratireductor pacificus pht-3B]
MCFGFGRMAHRQVREFAQRHGRKGRMRQRILPPALLVILRDRLPIAVPEGSNHLPENLQHDLCSFHATVE